VVVTLEQPIEQAGVGTKAAADVLTAVEVDMEGQEQTARLKGMPL